MSSSHTTAYDCEFFVKLRAKLQTDITKKDLTIQFLRDNFPDEVDSFSGFMDYKMNNQPALK